MNQQAYGIGGFPQWLNPTKPLSHSIMGHQPPPMPAPQQQQHPRSNVPQSRPQQSHGTGTPHQPNQSQSNKNYNVKNDEYRRLVKLAVEGGKIDLDMLSTLVSVVFHKLGILNS
jgi:hypothetical protein